MAMQVVTNSLPIANLFINDERVELIVTGGLLYPRYGVLLGPTAENIISTIHTKSLFLSVAGIYEGALYNQNLLLVQSERKMMEQSQQVVLLADSGKFGQQARKPARCARGDRCCRLRLGACPGSPSADSRRRLPTDPCPLVRCQCARRRTIRLILTAVGSDAAD